MVLCLIAVEKEVAYLIKENLEKSDVFRGWRFEVCTDAALLADWSGLPDVVLLSRSLPGEDPVTLLKKIRTLFPMARIVLLAGAASEAQRAYIGAAARLGFHDVVTGKLPGDRPYTIFAALRGARPVCAESASPEGRESPAEQAPWTGAAEESALGLDFPPPSSKESGVLQRDVAEEGRDAALLKTPQSRRFGIRESGSPEASGASASGAPLGRGHGGAGVFSGGYARWVSMVAGGQAGARIPVRTDGGDAEARAQGRAEEIRPAGVGPAGPLENVVGFFSGAKGGVGKTTLAANLAAWLATRGKKVVVVDADASARGISVLAFGTNEETWPPGVAVSRKLGGAAVYPPCSVVALAQIGREYDVVLVDFGSQFTGEAAGLLAACGSLVVVAVPEQLAVNVITRFMHRERYVLRGRLFLVVNRVRPRSEIPPWRVGDLLGLSITVVIPETAEIQKASRRGLVPVSAFKKGSIAKSVASLWEKIASDGKDSGVGKRSLFSFLR